MNHNLKNARHQSKVEKSTADARPEGEVRRVRVVLRDDVARHLHLVHVPPQVLLHAPEQLHAVAHRHGERAREGVRRRRRAHVFRKRAEPVKRIRAERIVRRQNLRLERIVRRPRAEVGARRPGGLFLLFTRREQSARGVFDPAHRLARRTTHRRTTRGGRVVVHAVALVKVAAHRGELRGHLAIPLRLLAERADHAVEQFGTRDGFRERALRLSVRDGLGERRGARHRLHRISIQRGDGEVDAVRLRRARHHAHLGEHRVGGGALRRRVRRRRGFRTEKRVELDDERRALRFCFAFVEPEP
mmetsp:Transcript_1179/g.4661  ORF Transcript_1179/g.4661 Transcript_1179/m.4661 type:complete len:302 (+) Transcript_1179:155-1060(+)